MWELRKTTYTKETDLCVIEIRQSPLFYNIYIMNKHFLKIHPVKRLRKPISLEEVQNTAESIDEVFERVSMPKDTI